MKALHLFLLASLSTITFAQLGVVIPDCAAPCGPRTCPVEDQCCFCEESRRLLFDKDSYQACIQRNCDGEWNDLYRALDDECHRSSMFGQNCKAYDLIDVDNPYHSDYDAQATADRANQRLIKAQKDLAMKAGIGAGVGGLVLIVVVWLCCWDHRRKKKKMRLVKEKQEREDMEKAAAKEEAVSKPGPDVIEYTVSPELPGSYHHSQAPVQNAYFPPSSTSSPPPQQPLEDDLAYQERRIAERKRVLEERKRIALEEERLAADEEDLRRRRQEGGRISAYELGDNPHELGDHRR